MSQGDEMTTAEKCAHLKFWAIGKDIPEKLDERVRLVTTFLNTLGCGDLNIPPTTPDDPRLTTITELKELVNSLETPCHQPES